jgi:GMP synthase (glutamine-hydrolysing)
METRERIVILDFGSQYTQVIARRIRECNVYSEILPYWTSASQIAGDKPKGIVLSGGPASVYGSDAPMPDKSIFDIETPILGICYGLQIIARFMGGEVAPAGQREYGRCVLQRTEPSELLADLPESLEIWSSHGDKLTRLPRGFRAVARSDNSSYAAIENGRIFGLQFHPEVSHTPRGMDILRNFVRRVCGCKGSWTSESFIERSVEEIRQRVGNERVILGLSGGVDSSVAAALLHRAIGPRLACILVDNGLLRANEAQSVQSIFGAGLGLDLRIVDASKRFLFKLRSVADPEKKRKIIGHEFIRVFEQAAKGVGQARFLAQGTLYPDVIESVPIDGNPAALIKTHHNVGGLPKRMKLELIEPLRQLFKDEVRSVGESLGLPKEMVWRQPFPGPGLAVRCLGPVDAGKLKMLREADAIVVAEMKNSGYYHKLWQSFAVLLPVRSVGVMGDERTYEWTVAIRAVESQDAMTADWARLPYDLLSMISNRIINEVRGVNRVVLDISSKPPSTIEWE